MKSQKEFEDEQSSEGSEEEEEEEQGAGGKGRGLDRALRRCSPLMVRLCPALRLTELQVGWRCRCLALILLRRLVANIGPPLPPRPSCLDLCRCLRFVPLSQVYAFKRLCRGLGSSRQGARQGFSLAITALLGATECVGPAEAVAAIEGVLEPAGKVRRRAAVGLPALPALCATGHIGCHRGAALPKGRAGTPCGGGRSACGKRRGWRCAPDAARECQAGWQRSSALGRARASLCIHPPAC